MLSIWLSKKTKSELILVRQILLLVLVWPISQDKTGKMLFDQNVATESNFVLLITPCIKVETDISKGVREDKFQPQVYLSGKIL